MKAFIIHSNKDNEVLYKNHLKKLIDSLPNIEFLLLSDNKRKHWKHDATRKIKQADFAIYFVGESSAKSDNIDFEIKKFINKRKNVFVIKLDEKYQLNDCLYRKPKYSNNELVNKDSLFLGIDLKLNSFVEDIKCLIENSDQSIINNCNDTEILLKQYEVYLKTSEDLVSRRQSVSNFYISVNTALLTVLSAIIAIINIIDAKYSPFVSICTGLFISLLGAALCLNWKRIIQSYGELNSAKMKVISKIEKYLPFNLYDTEWKIQCSNLGKKKYKSFTTLEKTIPLIFLIVYGIAFIASIILLFINL